MLRRFCAHHTGADAVVTTMLDESGTGLVQHAAGEAVGDCIDLNGASIVALSGPFCCRAKHGRLPLPWGEALPQCGSLLGLPIVFAGQTRGVVLLGFDLDEPSAVDLELLTTVVAQAASACERSQLQRLAVLDPVTGAFAPAYFRRRVVDEVSLAHYGDYSFSLLAFRVSERNRSARRLQQFVQVLRSRIGEGAFVGHGGSGSFYMAVPHADRLKAEAVRQDVIAAWRAEGRRGGIEVGGLSFGSAVSVFPSEAASSEFLLEAVEQQLASDPVREAVEAESDVSLRRAGVTAVSAAMRPVYSTLRRVAPTDLPILLEGETGVGKEVLTNLVHQWSRRNSGPLVKVHCAALTETLLASELFGHERGAFTGADRRKIGRFEQANGGTLFLDEVGEIPHDVQVALLRALQEGEIDRVGGSEAVKVDVRVIAATNRDMREMVRVGRFREDLYYRLQGMVVVVPPLRERREELAELARQFVTDIVAAGHTPARELSTEALDELYRQEWPGNIRQLRTTVFRALVLARGAVVRQHDVLLALAGGGSLAEADAAEQAPVAEKRSSNMPAMEPGQSGPNPRGPGENSEVGRGGGESIGGEGHAADLVPREPSSGSANAAKMPGAGQIARNDPELLIPQPDIKTLTPRLQQLLSEVQRCERYTTQDHMTKARVSHRTALRDLQALVRHGVVERVGARRGAFYRPFWPTANSKTVNPADG